MWVWWCRNALSDGVVRRGASSGAGPLACPVLGTVRVAEAPGSRAAAGRRAAIAERPLRLEGRPGNLRGGEPHHHSERSDTTTPTCSLTVPPTRSPRG